jgi:hypothetical protein
MIFLLLTMILHVTIVEAAVSPSWRSFHAAAIVDTSMIIYGGTTDPTQSPYGPTVPGSSDIWVWSTTEHQWSKPAIQFQGSTSLAPPPQKFLTAVTLDSKGKMMSIVANTSSSSNCLLTLDSVFWVWSTPDSRNPFFFLLLLSCFCLDPSPH